MLAAIDEFAKTKYRLPNIGPIKGKYITDLIDEVKPEFMVELGSYVGYSAVLFGDAVRRVGGKRYIGLEKSPEFAAVTNMIVELAGLRDFVTIIVGSSAKTLQRWATTGEVKQIPLLFIDHFKPLYVKDLKLSEHYGLVAPGSVLAADNVISPGAPDYLAYVRSSVEEKRKVAKEFEKKTEKEEFEFAGNPNLVYDTKLFEAQLSEERKVCVADDVLGSLGKFADIYYRMELRSRGAFVRRKKFDTVIEMFNDHDMCLYGPDQLKSE